MKKWTKLQRIIVSDNGARCAKCGSDILEITNIKYAGETKSTPELTEELYECRKCSTQFIIQYPLFDDKGHIQGKTFSEDINDPTHNWQDNLSPEQVKIISDHLKECPLCRERHDEEILKDAWFASLFQKGVKI